MALLPATAKTPQQLAAAKLRPGINFADPYFHPLKQGIDFKYLHDQTYPGIGTTLAPGLAPATVPLATPKVSAGMKPHNAAPVTGVYYEAPQENSYLRSAAQNVHTGDAALDAQLRARYNGIANGYQGYYGALRNPQIQADAIAASGAGAFRNRQADMAYADTLRQAQTDQANAKLQWAKTHLAGGGGGGGHGGGGGRRGGGGGRGRRRSGGGGGGSGADMAMPAPPDSSASDAFMAAIMALLDPFAGVGSIPKPAPAKPKPKPLPVLGGGGRFFS